MELILSSQRAEMLAYQRIGYFGAFMTGMFTELAIRGVGIERHIVLL